MLGLEKHKTYIKKGDSSLWRLRRAVRVFYWVTVKRFISDLKYTWVYGERYAMKTRVQKDRFKKRRKYVNKYGSSFLQRKAKTKERLARRDGPYCRTCLRYNMHPQPPLKELTIDHIVRIADGGSNDDDNLQLLCVKHHVIKDSPKPVID